MQESIDRFRAFARTTEGKAVLSGLAVFAVLYLHVAASSYATWMTFGGASLIKALLWPLFGLVWFTVPSLAVFAGVGFYVYWLKRVSPGVRELQEQVKQWRETAEGVARLYESEQGRMSGYAEEAQRNYREERERRQEAEARAAAAEARAGAGSGDEALRRAEARAAAAEKRAAAAEARAAEASKGNKAGGGIDKIREAKRSFARLYHPDNVQGGGIEKMVRQEIFKEFWRELERIEKS